MPLDTSPYLCSYCAWVFDPAEGCPEAGVRPGTPFADIPAGFRCPQCGGKAKWFEPCTIERALELQSEYRLPRVRELP